MFAAVFLHQFDDEEIRMKTTTMKAPRATKGWTQRELAEQTECSEALVSKIETGRALGIQSWEVGA